MVIIKVTNYQLSSGVSVADGEDTSSVSQNFRRDVSVLSLDAMT